MLSDILIEARLSVPSEAGVTLLETPKKRKHVMQETERGLKKRSKATAEIEEYQ